MAEARERRTNEFGIELDDPLPAPRIPSEAPNASRAITIFVALTVYMVVAFAVYNGSRASLVDSPSSAVEMEAQGWSEMLFLGGVIGIPGMVIAASLTTPHKPGVAPFVGIGAGVFHYLLGFGTLCILHRWLEWLVIPAGLAYFLVGWAWALIPRRCLAGHRSDASIRT